MDPFYRLKFKYSLFILLNRVKYEIENVMRNMNYCLFVFILLINKLGKF